MARSWPHLQKQSVPQRLPTRRHTHKEYAETNPLIVCLIAAKGWLTLPVPRQPSHLLSFVPAFDSGQLPGLVNTHHHCKVKSDSAGPPPALSGRKIDRRTTPL